MADSTITVIGNLSRDVELRYTNGGKAQVSGSVAVNRRYQVNGEWKEEVSFINFAAWDKLAENLAQSATKGTRLIITGRLEQREYEKKDGTKQSIVQIVADDAGLSLRWDSAQSDRVERSKPRAKVEDDLEPF